MSPPNWPIISFSLNSYSAPSPGREGNYYCGGILSSHTGTIPPFLLSFWRYIRFIGEVQLLQNSFQTFEQKYNLPFVGTQAFNIPHDISPSPFTQNARISMWCHYIQIFMMLLTKAKSSSSTTKKLCTPRIETMSITLVWSISTMQPLYHTMRNTGILFVLAVYKWIKNSFPSSAFCFQCFYYSDKKVLAQCYENNKCITCCKGNKSLEPQCFVLFSIPPRKMVNKHLETPWSPPWVLHWHVHLLHGAISRKLQ